MVPYGSVPGGYGIYTYQIRAERFHKYPFDASGFIEGDPQHMYFNFRTGAAGFNILDQSREPVIPASLWKSDWMNPIVYCRSSQGDLWVQVESTSRKCYLLFKYDRTAQRLEDFSSIRYNDPDGQLLAMFTDSKDRLWQLCYDADRTRKFIVCDGIHPRITATYPLPLPADVNKVSSFLNSTFEDSNGQLWFSTNLGLLRFDTLSKRWKIFKNNPSDASSLSSDIVFSVCPDPHDPVNTLWVGTNGRGLNRMDIRTGKCKRYDEADGLPNNVVYGLLNDDMGNLWISTNQGLSCFNLKRETFRNYTDEDGLMGNEFNRGQFYRSSRGVLFFGGVDGITWFNPREILASAQSPGYMSITGFSLYNKTIDFKRDSSLFQQAIQYTKSITLSASQNMFTIEFALLQFSGADKKRYQYLLEGFDQNWIDNGSKNSATFTNLDPGEYTFRVKGRNSDGVWSANSAELRIVVLTPWYASWWFTALWCLSLVASLYGFYRYRLAQSLRVISMRNRIASDLHDEIGSTISSISVYSDILEDKLPDAEMKQIAARISNSSRNILVVMSDIVWSINPKNDRFDNVILRMKSFAHEVLEAQEKTVYFESDPKLDELRMQMNDRKNFYLIFKEALNNVVKYADAKHVWIQISLHGNELRFLIRDDGVGFDLTEKKEGNGLLNMQRRSRDLNGELIIRSEPGKGTEVNLRFPVN